MTQQDLRTVLGDLVSVNNRLTRLAASSSGNTESPAIWRTIAVLRDLGPMRLGQLALVSRVSQPTMTKLVHTLDERGWVRRIADAGDARAWLISADPSGIAALNAWRDEIATVLEPTFDDLTDDEIETLAASVEIVRTRLERARAALQAGDAA